MFSILPRIFFVFSRPSAVELSSMGVEVNS